MGKWMDGYLLCLQSQRKPYYRIATEILFRCERGLCHLSCPSGPVPMCPLKAGTRMQRLVETSPKPHCCRPHWKSFGHGRGLRSGFPSRQAYESPLRPLPSVLPRSGLEQSQGVNKAGCWGVGPSFAEGWTDLGWPHWSLGATGMK